MKKEEIVLINEFGLEVGLKWTKKNLMDRVRNLEKIVETQRPLGEKRKLTKADIHRVKDQLYHYRCQLRKMKSRKRKAS